jgi:hypothetical protein
VCFVAFLLLSIFPGDVPGLHADEAWVFIRCKEIDAGVFHLNSYNGYTGTLHHFLIFPFFKLFGYRVGVLRAASACLTTLAVFFFMLLVKRLHPGRRYHIPAGLFLGTLPLFITQSRYCVETTSLVPLLSFAGLYFMALAATANRPSREIKTAMAGGACFGLAAYSHIVALPVPAAFFCAFALVYPQALPARRKMLLWSLAGFTTGFSPRLAWLAKNAFFPSADVAPAGPALPNFLGFLGDISSLPAFFAGALDGPLVFRRMTGECMVPILPYVSLALPALALAGLLLKKQPSRFDVAALLAVALLLLADLAITPCLALHYFEPPLLFTAYFIVRLCGPLLNADSGALRRLGSAAMALLVAGNIFYVSTNFFAQFRMRGGGLSVFTVGKRCLETSNGFVSVKNLHAGLRERRVVAAAGPFFILCPLLVYDMPFGTLKPISMPDSSLPPPDSFPAGRRCAIIYYNGPLPLSPPGFIRNVGVVGPPREARIRSGTRVFRADGGFDGKFKVYIEE